MNIYTTTGTEGPRFDPYAYTEITVTLRHQTPVTIHLGLGAWVSYGKARSGQLADDVAQKTFAMLTGYTVTQIERWLRKRDEAKYRAHKSHGGTEWREGFPGEALCICKCGHVIDSSFDEGVII